VVIANTVRKYAARVAIRSDKHVVDAADVLDLLSLGADQGTELVLSAQGPQAQEALEALIHLFDVEFDVAYED
jgi:phosphotransferase system HPr (HPr) family protein